MDTPNSSASNLPDFLNEVGQVMVKLETPITSMIQEPSTLPSPSLLIHQPSVPTEQEVPPRPTVITYKNLFDIHHAKVTELVKELRQDPKKEQLIVDKFIVMTNQQIRKNSTTNLKSAFTCLFCGDVKMSLELQALILFWDVPNGIQALTRILSPHWRCTDLRQNDSGFFFDIICPLTHTEMIDIARYAVASEVKEEQQQHQQPMTVVVSTVSNDATIKNNLPKVKIAKVPRKSIKKLDASKYAKK